MSLRTIRTRKLGIAGLCLVLGCMTIAGQTASVVADEPSGVNRAQPRDLIPPAPVPIEMEVEVWEVSDPDVLLKQIDDVDPDTVDGWFVRPQPALQKQLPAGIRRLGFSRFRATDGAAASKHMDFPREMAQPSATEVLQSLQIAVTPRLLPGDEISLDYEMIRNDAIGELKISGSKQHHLGQLTALWVQRMGDANVGRLERQMQNAVSQLISHQKKESSEIARDNPPAKKKLCFVCLENKSAEELGDFGELVYDKICSSFRDTGTFEVINHNAAAAVLRGYKLRPDELLIPDNSQKFATAMEQAQQPFDFLLHAKVTSVAKRDKQRLGCDCLLNLELVDVKGRNVIKLETGLDRSSDKDTSKSGSSWLVLMNPRPKSPDGRYAAIKVHESHSPIAELAFYPRPGRYELQVEEGWLGGLLAGAINDSEAVTTMDRVSNFGHSKDAKSDGPVPVTFFSAERPVLEVVNMEDGFMQVVARRAGTAYMRIPMKGLEGKREFCELSITVEANLTDFDRAVQELIPGAVVKVHQLNESAMLTGTVGSDEEKRFLAEIAEQFFPKILNRVSVQSVTERRADSASSTPMVEKASAIDLQAATPRGQVIEEEEVIEAGRNSIPQIPRPSPAIPEKKDNSRVSNVSQEAGKKGKRNRLPARDAERILQEVQSLRQEVRELTDLMQQRATESDKQRPADVDPAPADSPKTAKSHLGLLKKVSVKFNMTPLEKVLAELAGQAQLDLVLDPSGLEEEGVTATAPVTIQLAGVSCRSALNLILQPLGLGTIQRDEVIVVTSRLRAQGRLSTKVYPVDDVLKLSRARTPDGAGRELVDLLSQTVSPDSWDAVGGPAAVRYSEIAKSLVIRQTEATHTEIEELLQQIRRLQRIPEAKKSTKLDQAINLRKKYPVRDATRPENLQVTVYSVADLVVPLPNGGESKMPGPKDWMPVVDRVKESVDANAWEENGGPCSLRVHDQSLSLVIRATPGLHEQIAATLNSMRRYLDRQIVISTSILHTADDSGLDKSGLPIKFGANTHVARLNATELERLATFVGRGKGEMLFAPKITIFDGDIAEVHSGANSTDSDGEILHLYVRGRWAPGDKDVQLNLACNPKDLLNALATHSHRIPPDGGILFDMTDELFGSRPVKPKGRVLVLVQAHGIDAAKEEAKTRESVFEKEEQPVE